MVAFSSHGRRRPRKERQIRTKISLKIIVVMMIVVMVMRKRRISSKTPLRIMRLTKKQDARYTKITLGRVIDKDAPYIEITLDQLYMKITSQT